MKKRVTVICSPAQSLCPPVHCEAKRRAKAYGAEAISKFLSIGFNERKSVNKGSVLDDTDCFVVPPRNGCKRGNNFQTLSKKDGQ